MLVVHALSVFAVYKIVIEIPPHYVTAIMPPKRSKKWSQEVPSHGKARHKMATQCPDCFLKPPEGYPVCAQCGKASCSCVIRREGVMAAKRRAYQQGDLEV